jgi:glycosyltransferase involved in cell wall biosynthesis
VLALGFVEPLARLLAAADVAVNPVEAGSGSNLKLAEYVAAGLPVVTTPVGLRGYEAFRAHVTVAELSEFATAVQARSSTEDHRPDVDELAWTALARKLHERYLELLSRRPRERTVR